MVCWSGTQASSNYAHGVVQDTADEASVSLAIPDWRIVSYLAVEYTRDKVAMRSVLAPAPHQEPTSRLNSVTREDSFLRNATKW